MSVKAAAVVVIAAARVNKLTKVVIKPDGKRVDLRGPAVVVAIADIIAVGTNHGYEYYLHLRTRLPVLGLQIVEGAQHLIGGITGFESLFDGV
ncbi:MAG: hypothetical protein CVV05_13090 [Gammaproteobacteria bacterium HGW-Gammaproteobacteria-1]|nr:MAG: hypothetical protein CVV05_13090 [Gammaproteobacteria bacterium HGW-Gammaproteobacteria-1]